MTKQDLCSLRCLDKEIKSKQEHLAHLYTLAESCTSPTNKGGSRNNGKKNDFLGDISSDIADLKNELENDVKKLIAAKHQAVKTIGQLSNPIHRTLLEKRYLLFKPWQKVAFEMNYSADHLYTLQRKALQELKTIKKSIDI